MKARAEGRTKAVAIVARAVMMVVAGLLLTFGTTYAQGEPVDARSEQCRQLLKKQVSQLTDEQLRILKRCLEPLERRKKEKAESADQLLAPAERKAPLRIYGK